MIAALRSPLTEDHHSKGTELGEYHGVMVPLRFSDHPGTEHEAVRRAAGIFDFSFRSKFTAHGPDHVAFLHNMLSNDVKSLVPGEGVYATLLNVKGQILADLRLYRDADQILIDTDADLREKVMQTLERYVLMDDVTLAPVELVSIAIQGPRSSELLQAALQVHVLPLAEFGHIEAKVEGVPNRIVRASSTGDEGYEVWAVAEGIVTLWRALLSQAPNFGALPCGTEALETLRIEAGIPRYGRELGEDMLPLEAGLLNALSFTKGCYVGQEVVERSRSRGHVNWRLVGLVSGVPTPPPPGEKVLAKGKECGEVTSAGFSPTLGKSIALAYVRREVSEPGARLELASGQQVKVSELPFYRRQRDI